MHANTTGDYSLFDVHVVDGHVYVREPGPRPSFEKIFSRNFARFLDFLLSRKFDKIPEMLNGAIV